MNPPVRVLMLFLDGVGIGRKDPSGNPFFCAELPALKRLLGGRLPSARSARFSIGNASCVPVSSTLGVPGLPQSGTGQTALFTGCNAARAIGKHFGPYPYSSLIPVIRERNIFRKLLATGRKVCYSNAFPKQYFEHIRAHPNRMTVPSMSYASSGHALADATALEEGRALSADITNERWASLGYPQIRPLSATDAGRRLARIAAENDFTLYEYFLTDHAGHTRSLEKAKEVLERLDGLLMGVLEESSPETLLILIASDHGNIEDLSSKGHTKNRVPLIAYGAHHREVTANVTDLTHITPNILKLLS